MPEPTLLLAIAKTEISKLVLKYLAKSFLESKPDLKQIVRGTIKDAISDFQIEFKDVEIFTDDQFLSLLNDVGSEATDSNNEESRELKTILSERIFSESLLFHSIEHTKRIYSDSFADKFCLRLYSNLLNSKFAGLLQAKEIIAASEFREVTTDQLKVMQESLDKIVERLPEISDASQLTKSSFSGADISDDYPELTNDEDNEIADLFSKIEELTKTDAKFEELVGVSKSILSKVPPSRSNLFHKAYNHLLSSYLRGGKIAWEIALRENEKWTGTKNSYSNVILAALYNNLQNWGQALQLIGSIPKSDIVTFSEKQKNYYYMIFALIKYHLKQDAEARLLLEKANDKEDTEYINIQFLLYSKDKENILLPRATEILSSEKHNLKAIQSAVYYIIDRFSIVQSSFGNAIDARAELRPHLELAFSTSKKLIESNRSGDSDSLRSLIVAIPALARLLERENEVIDLIKIGLDRGYDGFFFLHNCAECFLKTNMIEEGILCCEKMSLKELVLYDGLDLYLLFLEKAGQKEKLLKVYEEIKLLNIAEEKKWKALVSASRANSSEHFLQVALDAYSKFSEKGWATLYLADSYVQNRKYDEAIDLLKKGMEKSDIGLQSKVHLAKLLAVKLQKYEEALPYYEEIIKKETPVQEKYEYVICLFELDLFGEAITKIDQFDPDAKIMSLQRIKAYSCTQMGLLSPAKEILKCVCSVERNDFEAHYNYAILCQQLGHNDDLVETLKEVVRIRPDHYNSHLLLSQGLFNQRKFKDAVIHARFALLGDFQNSVCHFNFMNIHRVASEALPEDKFIRSEELTNLHRDILSKFFERFPDNKLLQKFEIPEKDDGSFDLNFFKDMLEEQDAWRTNLLSMYKEKSFPVAFLINGLNLDSHEVWSFLAGSGDQSGLIVNRLSTQVLEKDLLKIKSADALILDGITLIALKSAGIFDALSKINKKIIVGSKTSQEFIQIKHRFNSTNGGHLSLGLEQGKLVKELISAERIESVRNLIDEISQYITNSANVLASDIQQEKKREGDIRGILDDSYKELWDLCGYPKTVSIWADGNLINLSHSVGKSASSLQSLVMFMLDSKAITREQYAIAIGKMVLANYKGLMFTAEAADIFITKHLDVGEFYFRKVSKGPYFSNIEGRVGFLSKLVVKLIKGNSDLKWMTQAVSDFFVDQNVDYGNKLLFCIGLYSDGIAQGVDYTKVDEFLTSLNLRTIDSTVITPDICKSYIQEAIVQKKLAEADSVLKKLGLPEK